MASRGARAAGTDGSDHTFRETIPARTRVEVKKKLKLFLLGHVALWLVMVLKLSEDLLDRLDILIPDIAELAIPKPVLWEYCWALSIIPAVMGLASLSRNQVLLLKMFIFGILLLGLGPILGGMGFYLRDLIDYASQRSTKQLFRGYPIVVLWYVFFVAALQIHGFSLKFARQLSKIWDKGPKIK